MFKNPVAKNIFYAVAIAFFGFILLNLTFIFDWLIQTVIDQFFPADFNMTKTWYPPIKHLIFVVIMALISWGVFKSRLSAIYKAIYTTVPVAVALVTTGIFLYRWPILAYSVSAVIVGAIILYLYRTKKTWLYYYAVILMASVLLIMSILGVEI